MTYRNDSHTFSTVLPPRTHPFAPRLRVCRCSSRRGCAYVCIRATSARVFGGCAAPVSGELSEVRVGDVMVPMDEVGADPAVRTPRSSMSRTRSPAPAVELVQRQGKRDVFVTHPRPLSGPAPQRLNSFQDSRHMRNLGASIRGLRRTRVRGSTGESAERPVHEPAEAAFPAFRHPQIVRPATSRPPLALGLISGVGHQRARRGRGWQRGQVYDERFMNGSRRIGVPQRAQGSDSRPYTCSERSK